MEIKIYNQLPSCSMDIRITVFVREQGFSDQEDETDRIATHIVMFDGSKAIATCRVFREDQTNSFILGRLAVLKEYRDQGIGGRMINAAEEHVRFIGGSIIRIHSQYSAKGFYEFCGYTQFGELEYEQGRPHVWMKKEISRLERG